jgi:uncharacterized protein involved in exopolysaccharide biosynthesis
MDQTRLEYRPANADLTRLWLALLAGRWVIVLASVGALLASLTYIYVTPATYRAEALLQPVETSAGRSVSPLVAQFAGLGDLAGFSMGSGADRAVAIATLRSRAVVVPFIEQEGLLARLYVSSKPYTSWHAYEYFTDSILRISDDRKTGLVTVAVEWSNASEAQAWVSKLVERANDHLKARAIEEGERNLAFLQAQSSKIGQVELQQALHALVELEMQKVMIAKGGEALRVIDAAVVPLEPVWPKPAYIVIGGLIVGLGLGVVIVLMTRASEWLVPAGSH